MRLAVLVARGPRDLRRDGTAYSARTQVWWVSAAAVPARWRPTSIQASISVRCHSGGEAQFSDLPVPGGLELVLAIAEGPASALGQQGSPPGATAPRRYPGRTVR